MNVKFQLISISGPELNLHPMKLICHYDYEYTYIYIYVCEHIINEHRSYQFRNVEEIHTVVMLNKCTLCFEHPRVREI